MRPLVWVVATPVYVLVAAIALHFSKTAWFTWMTIWVWGPMLARAVRRAIGGTSYCVHRLVEMPFLGRLSST